MLHSISKWENELEIILQVYFELHKNQFTFYPKTDTTPNMLKVYSKFHIRTLNDFNTLLRSFYFNYK